MGLWVSFLYFFIFWLFLSGSIWGFEKGTKNLTTRLGGSGNTFQSRFVDRENSQYGDIWLELDRGNWKGILEKREDQFLGSVAYQNDYFFIGTGHRYKPFSGFFWGKEERLYSTLTTNQPLYQSSFFSLFPGYFSPGVFHLESYTGKNNLGYSLAFPQDAFILTYAPNTQFGSVSTHIDQWKWKKPAPFLHNLYFSLMGEVLGTKKNYFGRKYLYFGNPDSIWLELRAYRDFQGNLFESPDPFQEVNTSQFNSSESFPREPDTIWAKIYWGRYHFLEGLDNYANQRFRYAGIQTGIIPLPWGRLAYRHRTYEVFKNKDEELISFHLPSHAGLWVIEKKGLSFHLGREWRANQDALTEAGFSWKIAYTSIQTVLYFQKEGNEFPFPIERFMADGRQDISLSDRKTVVRFRIRNKNIDWNFTSSERMGRRGSVFFMNFQFFYEF